MKNHRSHWHSYAIAILTVFLALVLTIALKPLFSHTPTPLFFTAVIISSSYGGLGQGLLAAVLSCLCLEYLLLERGIESRLFPLSDLILLGIFAGTSIFISSLNNARQKAEKNLRDSEKTYHLLVDNITDHAFFSLDLNGNITTWNQGAETITGYKPHEIINKHFSQLYTKEDQELDKPNQLLEIARNESRCEEQSWRVRKDNTKFWSQSIITALRDNRGNLTGYSKIIHNITQSKQSEQKLYTTLKELSDLKIALEESAIVAKTDNKGIINYVNKKFSDISKYSPEELIGKTHKIINSGYHTPEFFAELWQTIASGKIWKGEIKNKAKDGTYYWVDTTIVPMPDEKGKPKEYLSIRSDITERKQAQDALKASEELLKKVLETLPVGVAVADQNGQIIMLNPETKKIWGGLEYFNIPEYAEYKGWWYQTGQRIPSEDWGIVRAIRNGETSLDEIIEIEAFDGTHKIIRNAAVPIRNTQEEIVGAIAVNQDITALIKAQKERDLLLESERKARTSAEIAEQQIAKILDRITDGFFAVDNEWKFTYVNPQVVPILQKYGYMGSRENLVGKTMWEAFPASINNIFESHYRASKDQQIATNFEAFYEPLNLWLEIHAYPDEQGLSIYFQDITERKIAEDTRRESEERFHNMADNSPVFLWVSDSQGLCTFVNKSWLNFTGRRLEQELGTRWEKSLHPDDWQLCFDTYSQAIKNRSSFSLEYRLLRADGEYRWIFETAIPRFTNEGNFLGHIGSASDITERKMAEEELKNRTRTSAAIAQLGQRALAGIKLSTLMQETVTLLSGLLNLKSCQILELNSEDGELIEQASFHNANQTNREGSAENIDSLEVSYTLEISGRGEPFGFIRIETQNQPLTKEDLHFCQGAANILAEAHSRKHSEQERAKLLQREQNARKQAEASQQYYRFLAESIPQMVWTANPDGKVDYYNQRWFDYLGVAPSQLVENGWSSMVHPEDLGRCLQTWTYCQQTGENYEIEVRVKNINGQYRWYLGQALAMRDSEGKIVKWFGTNTDIDDRKRTEQERAHLLEREQAARTLAEAATERVHRLQAVTDATITAISLDDLLKESLARISQVLNADIAVIFLTDADKSSLVIKAALGLETEVIGSLKIGIGEGIAGRIASERQPVLIDSNAYQIAQCQLFEEKHIETLMGVPLVLEDKVLGVIYAGTLDVRQFSKDDMYLLELVADRLAWAIDRANLYEAEQKARSAAENANRLKDEFLAIVSHELRTPLNSILGWAQMLRIRKLDANMTARALETIERNAKQQVKVIDDILDVSRIIRGKFRLTLVVVNFAEIVRDCVENFAFSAGSKNINLSFNIKTNIAQINGDPDRLRQIISNLLSNAIKFTPEDGRIEVCLSQKDKQLELSVSDTGIGIDPEFLPHVFEGFRQADSSTTRSHGGLGLGLTIVSYLVELHGGNVKVFSEGKNKGSTFIVRLPSFQKNNLTTETANNSFSFSDSSEGVQLSGLTILVVDDDPDTCNLISTVLQEYGAEVNAVSSADEALSLLNNWVPDLLVTDIGMPEKSGYDLIREIRHRKSISGGALPAIALTAFAREEDRKKAHIAGFQMHVSKPVEPEELAKAVTLVCSHILHAN
ncbi:MAG TPA: PAS domain S-box protein [Halomicronema sp.]